MSQTVVILDSSALIAQLNVKDLLGPTDLTQSLPTVVVRQGTIVLEDQASAQTRHALEIMIKAIDSARSGKVLDLETTF